MQYTVYTHTAVYNFLYQYIFPFYLCFFSCNLQISIMASPQGYSPYPQGGYNSVPPNQEYQTLSVVAPYGVYPGQMFNITGPDGNPVQVQMPMGSAPGQTILVNVPVTRYAQPTYSQPPGPTYAPQQTPPQNMQSPPPQSYAPVQQQQHDLRPSSVPQHQLLSVQEKEARHEAETADAALAKAIEKSEEFHLHAQCTLIALSRVL